MEVILALTDITIELVHILNIGVDSENPITVADQRRRSLGLRLTHLQSHSNIYRLLVDYNYPCLRGIWFSYSKLKCRRLEGLY